MTKQRENGISWTEETWNPLRGCSRISKGCMNCYAEAVANRFKGEGQPYEGLIARTGQWSGTVRLVPEKLEEPIRWRRPRLIFVNSMSDLFHESVPDHEIDQIFGVMWACLGSDHTFQILTKRAKRMRNYFKTDRRHLWAQWAVHYGGGSNPDDIYDQTAYADEPHPRIWLGVSVEDQETADQRIPALLATPAAVRWVSAEPLLGAVNLHQSHDLSARTGNTEVLDWVVVGGESGSGARPMHPAWARSLRDQCVQAGVPFHFKQWGEWAPRDLWNPRCKHPQIAIKPDGTEVPHDIAPQDVGGQRLEKIGKAEAGRLLDGREWQEYPKAYNKEPREHNSNT